MTKILLVEDDKSLREIYGVRLLAEGYDIVSAGDGEEALAMAIKERPQLIVSDVMMPKISGFDMLDILRSTTETKEIKVIMMTALSSDDQRQRGQQLGADRYLVKSQVGIEDVVRTVHDVLGDLPGVGTDPVPTQAAQAAPAPAAVPTRPAAPMAPPPRAPEVTSAPAAPTAPAPAPQPQAPVAPAPVATPAAIPTASPEPTTPPTPPAPTPEHSLQFEETPLPPPAPTLPPTQNNQ
jgi:CheY-like chemotaxis protein